MRSGSITRWTGRLCAGAVALGLLTSATHAALLVSEPFSYPNGNLVGNTPSPGPGGTWAAHSGAGVGAVQVSGSAIIVQGATGQNEDVNIGLGATAGAGTVFYAAFDINVSASGTISQQYFAHFLQATNFTERMYIAPPTSSGFRLGLGNSATAGNAVFSSDLALGSSHRIVVSYNYDLKNGQLWIDPTSSSSPSLAPTDTGFANAVTAFAFRQPSSGNYSITIDNLCAATTFEEALNCGATATLSASGSATPATVPQGQSTLLKVTVSGGTAPYTVTGDLSTISGSGTQTFFDNATNGDEVAGDKIFSYLATVPCAEALGPRTLPITVTDAASGSATPSIGLNVTDGTTIITAQPPNIAVCAGGTARFTVGTTGVTSYQWFDGAGALNNGDRGGRVSGATSATLLISNAQASDVTAGPYYVQVTGPCTGSLNSNSATLAIATPATLADKEIVISRVYGGGGNSGAAFRNDYIQLFNKGAVPVDVTGWSVQYASSTTGGSQPDFSVPSRITILSGTIQAGKYYLIKEAAGTGGNTDLPAEDLDGTNLSNSPNGPINIGSVGAKIALVKHSGSLSGTCPASNGGTPDDCGIVDFLGWGGVTTGCAEGGAAAVTTSNTTAIQRTSACVDTDNNAADFSTIVQSDGGAPAAPLNPPANSASPAAPSIVTPPANALSCAGLTATFTVAADGPCLTYQWEVNQAPALAGFVPVSTGTGGTTASYTTAALAAGDAGNQYRVVVSNAYGPSATSAAATLSLGVTPADKQIIIASVYPAGGLGGTPSATYQNDYIELYNKGTTAVDITGWSIQYASATGTSWAPGALSGTIAPGNSFLIQMGSDNGCSGNTTPCGAALPTPNATLSLNMSGTAGKVALVKATTALPATACTGAVPSDCRIIDFVGYGATASCYEGAGAAPAATDRTHEISRPNVCTDTDNNNADFVSVVASPSAGGASSGIPGDFTGDGKVDSGTGLVITGSDFEIFKACETRDGVPYNPLSLPVGCTVTSDCNGKISADFDKDGDVDMRDFAVFQRCYSGTALGNPNCAN